MLLNILISPLKADSRSKLLLKQIDTTVGSGTVKDILPTQNFVSILDDNDRKRIQNAKSLDEIWNVCGEKVSALNDERLCRKLFKAMKSKCNNDENHEKVRKLEEVLEKYRKTFSSNTSAEEETGDEELEGHSTQTKKPIEQKPSQVPGEDATPEPLQDTQESTTPVGATSLDAKITSNQPLSPQYYEVATQATAHEEGVLVNVESRPADRGEYTNGIRMPHLCKSIEGEIVTGTTVGKINFSLTLNINFIMPA